MFRILATHGLSGADGVCVYASVYGFYDTCNCYGLVRYVSEFITVSA